MAPAPQARVPAGSTEGPAQTPDQGTKGPKGAPQTKDATEHHQLTCNTRKRTTPTASSYYKDNVLCGVYLHDGVLYR